MRKAKPKKPTSAAGTAASNDAALAPIFILIDFEDETMRRYIGRTPTEEHYVVNRDRGLGSRAARSLIEDFRRTGA